MCECVLECSKATCCRCWFTLYTLIAGFVTSYKTPIHVLYTYDSLQLIVHLMVMQPASAESTRHSGKASLLHRDQKHKYIPNIRNAAAYHEWIAGPCISSSLFPSWAECDLKTNTTTKQHLYINIYIHKCAVIESDRISLCNFLNYIYVFQNIFCICLIP